MSKPGNDETLGRGRWIRLARRGKWEYAERTNVSGIVLIVAVTDDGKLLLVEQPRPIHEARVIELPAGLAGDLAESADEKLVDAARRELLEETGYEAAHWDVLTEGPISPGMTTEVITVLRARGLQKTGSGGGDGHEDITVHEVPLGDVPEWLTRQRSRGLLVDPKAFLGVYFGAAQWQTGTRPWPEGRP